MYCRGKKRLLKWQWIANWGKFDKAVVFRIIRQLTVCTQKLAKKMCTHSEVLSSNTLYFSWRVTMCNFTMFRGAHCFHLHDRKRENVRQYVYQNFFKRSQHNIFQLHFMYRCQRENTIYFIYGILALERTTSLPTDVSACSEDLNAVIQNTLCVASETCRTVGTVFQSYMQETNSGGSEVGISKQSQCAVWFSFLFNIICVFV